MNQIFDFYFTLYSVFSPILYKTMQKIANFEGWVISQNAEKKTIFTLSMGTTLCCEVFVSLLFWRKMPNLGVIMLLFLAYLSHRQG